MNPLRLVLSLAVLLALLAPAHAAEDLDAFIQKAMKAYGVPGAVVVVIKDGQVAHLKGYGVRRIGHPEPVGPDTQFQLASITKTFTAALAGTAVDAGRLDWDRPVTDVLEEMQLAEPFPTANVTVRDFLVHRSGLPAFTGDLFDNLGYSRREVIRRIRHFPLVLGFRYKPGYSNVGFFLAGETAARAFGTTWEDAVRTHLLQPMKLGRTDFWAGPIPAGADAAWPHMAPKGGAPQALPAYDGQSVLAPAGEIVSTGADMARYALMYLNGGSLEGVRVLEEETVKTIFDPVIAEHVGFADLPPIGPDAGFAYSPGWGVYHYNGQKVMEKGGARAGMRSVITLVPAKRAGVVVLCNMNLTGFPEAVRARILEEVAGPAGYDVQARILEHQANLDKIFHQISALPQGPPKPVAPLTAELKDLAGRYESPLYGTLLIAQEGGALTWTAGPAKYGGHLWPLGHTTFQLVEPPGKISLPGLATFVVDQNGRGTAVQLEDFGQFTRVKEP